MMVPDPARQAKGESPSRRRACGAHTRGGVRSRVPAPDQRLAPAARPEGAGSWEDDLAQRGAQPHRRGAPLLPRQRAGARRQRGRERSDGAAAWLALEEYQSAEPRPIQPLPARSATTTSAVSGEDLCHPRGDLGLPALRGRPAAAATQREFWWSLVNSRTVPGWTTSPAPSGADRCEWAHDWTLRALPRRLGALGPAAPPAAELELPPRCCPSCGAAPGLGHERLPAAHPPLRVRPLLGLALPGGTSAFVRVSVPAGQSSARARHLAVASRPLRSSA